MNTDKLTPIGTDSKQSLKLMSAGIPDSTADMYLVKHWACCMGDLKIMDKHFHDYPPEGVDHIEAWSLSRLIDLLPSEIYLSENDDDDEKFAILKWKLQVEKNRVRYFLDSSRSPLYETEGVNTIDAVVNMLVKLCEEGYQNYIMESFEESCEN